MEILLTALNNVPKEMELDCDLFDDVADGMPPCEGWRGRGWKSRSPPPPSLTHPTLTPLIPLLALVLVVVLVVGGRVVEGVTSEPQRARRQQYLEQVTPLHNPSTIPPCLPPSYFDREIKPQHLYVNEREQPLTMLTSSHVPQQLMTRMVAIFLKEWLGYVNLTITTVPETFDPSSVVEAMSPPRDHTSLATRTGVGVHIPRAMVNLEVWVPPGYNLEPLTTEFDTSSYLGSGGRFGWFLPERLLAMHDFIIEHWRSFINRDSQALSLFYRTPEELAKLSNKMKDSITGEYYCGERLGCEKGMFRPPLCKQGNVCAVLFTSKADGNLTEFLHNQILSMKAYVQVAYIGPHLDHDFIRANINLPGSHPRSVLIFHWWPSVLLEPFQFTSVSFPPCIDSTALGDKFLEDVMVMGDEGGYV
ncbi:hypothetical protein Pcinc_040697 [Petrolisthes cinctipes]|uniref:Uncharacterized protein n=1 Tax=Petrolisthes cinctipes TaxID=88211 RepID=A0AAE1BKZ1_PETCI|nr:hypothetical protein Pcinc_040697 [Petrolisthes cinctipes]